MTIRVTIIGMDALGQSLGLALRALERKINVTGHDREPTRTAEAAKIGAIDQGDWNLLNAVEGADLIFLNEPLHQMQDTMGHIAGELRVDAVVTDSAPVKSVVIDWAREHFPDHVHYIPATPLVQATVPDATLFQGQRYAIVPPVDAPESAVRLVTNLAMMIGSEPLFLEAAEHDSFLGATEQLPMLVACGILALTTGSNGWRDLEKMGGAGFARATELPVESPAELAALLRANRGPLEHWLRGLQGELEALHGMMAAPDEEGDAELEERIGALMEAREAWAAGSYFNPVRKIFEEALDEGDSQRGLRRYLLGGRRR